MSDYVEFVPRRTIERGRTATVYHTEGQASTNNDAAAPARGKSANATTLSGAYTGVHQVTPKCTDAQVIKTHNPSRYLFRATFEAPLLRSEV